MAPDIKKLLDILPDGWKTLGSLAGTVFAVGDALVDLAGRWGADPATLQEVVDRNRGGRAKMLLEAVTQDWGPEARP